MLPLPDRPEHHLLLLRLALHHLLHPSVRGILVGLQATLRQVEPQVGVGGVRPREEAEAGVGQVGLAAVEVGQTQVVGQLVLAGLEKVVRSGELKNVFETNQCETLFLSSELPLQEELYLMPS